MLLELYNVLCNLLLLVVQGSKCLHRFGLDVLDGFAFEYLLLIIMNVVIRIVRISVQIILSKLVKFIEISLLTLNEIILWLLIEGIEFIFIHLFCF